MYTGIILTDESRAHLLKQVGAHIPDGWDVIAHHLTLNMGGIEDGFADPRFLNTKADIIVTGYAINDLVFAVRCFTIFQSVNKVPHITVAVNRAAGGKPVMSNNLTDWREIENPLALQGFIKEQRG